MRELASKLKRELSILRGNLLVLVVSWTFFRFGFSMVYPYESLYLQALGASPFVIGLIGSLGLAILCLSRIPGAYIADRYGRRKIIVTMTYGIALSYAMLALAPDWRLAAAGLALSNFCLIYQPALQAITADSIPPEKRGVGYAMANVVPAVPAVFAPLITGFLIEHYGFPCGMRMAYWLVVVLSLAAATVRALYLRETLETRAEVEVRKLGVELKRSLADVLEALRRMPRPLAVYAVVLFIGATGDPMFHRFVSLYAVDVAGISKPDWALLQVLRSAVALLAGLPLGKLVDAIGRKKSIVMAYALWAPAVAYFTTCRSLAALVPVFAGIAVGSALFLPAHQALIADFTPREMRGRVME